MLHGQSSNTDTDITRISDYVRKDLGPTRFPNDRTNFIPEVEVTGASNQLLVSNFFY